MKKITYSAPSVKKAFKILSAVSDAPNGLGISELSKQLKIGKSTVHGITSALEELGALVRDPLRKKYSVGYTLLELGRRAHGRIKLRDVARVPIERLMEKVGETVFLGIMNGDHITILDVVESRQEMKITSPPGTRLPLLAGATGKVFLSHFEKMKVHEILQRMGLVKFTSKSILDPKKFSKEVEETRRMGYAVDDEEYIPGVRAVAALIQAASFPPAAIWVVGFSSSLNDQKMQKAFVEIRNAADDISRAIKEHP